MGKKTSIRKDIYGGYNMKVTYPVIFTTYKKNDNGLELKSKNGKKIKITKL